MPRKRHTPEQIIGKLREAEVDLAGGQTVLEVCRSGHVVHWAIDPRRRKPSRANGLIRPSLWMGYSRISPSQKPCQTRR